MAKKDRGRTHPKAELIALLETLATEHEGHGRGQIGQDIRTLVQELNTGKRDAAEVRIKGRILIGKFAGTRLPEDLPVETQEFITEA
jgi:hypothetical protein